MHSSSAAIGITILCLGLLCSPASGAPDPSRPVTVTRPVRQPLVTTFELTGSFTARRQSQLSSRTAGLIEQIEVDAGHQVTEGDVLMKLDTSLAVLALEKAVAARRQAELELAESERLVVEGRNLAKVGGFSRSEAETRETHVRVRRALLENLAVQVREQEEIIARHSLPAPFSGVISRKLAEEGEWVQSGTAVLELVETIGTRLDLQAPQELYAALEESGTGPDNSRLDITVVIDAFPDQPMPATIQTLVPVKDQVTRTFLVRLKLDDSRELAAPGMSGRARFAIHGAAPVVQIPRDAVVTMPNGTTQVWVVEENANTHVVRPREVTLGRSLAGFVEVRQGLDDTPTLVLRGNEGLHDGQAVTLVADPAAAPSAPSSSATPR